MPEPEAPPNRSLTITYYWHNKAAVDPYLRRVAGLEEAEYEGWASITFPGHAAPARTLGSAGAALGVKVRFLLDENMEVQVRAALLRREPSIDILRVGNETAPPLRTPDPAVLLYVEEHQRMLITRNRASMSRHIVEHLSGGRHHWGVMRVRRSGTIAVLVESLLLIWGASEAEGWVNLFDWIPF